MANDLVPESAAKQELEPEDPRYLHAIALRQDIINIVGKRKFEALARHDPRNHIQEMETVLNYFVDTGVVKDPHFLNACRNLSSRSNVITDATFSSLSDEVVDLYAALQQLNAAANDSVVRQLEEANREEGIYQYPFEAAFAFLGDEHTPSTMREVSLFLQYPTMRQWEKVMREKIDTAKLLAYFAEDVDMKQPPKGFLNGFSGSALLNILDNLHKYKKEGTKGKVTRRLEADDSLTWIVENDSDNPWEDRLLQPSQRAKGNIHGGTGLGLPLIGIDVAAAGGTLITPTVGSKHLMFTLATPFQL